jgi:hypothetical protein
MNFIKPAAEKFFEVSTGNHGHDLDLLIVIMF